MLNERTNAYITRNGLMTGANPWTDYTYKNRPISKTCRRVNPKASNWTSTTTTISYEILLKSSTYYKSCDNFLVSLTLLLKSIITLYVVCGVCENCPFFYKSFYCLLRVQFFQAVFVCSLYRYMILTREFHFFYTSSKNIIYSFFFFFEQRLYSGDFTYSHYYTIIFFRAVSTIFVFINRIDLKKKKKKDVAIFFTRNSRTRVTC